MPDLIESPAIYVGIDPGASGGLAAISNFDSQVLSMPESERDIWNWFYQDRYFWQSRDVEIFAVVEQVGGYVPREGSGQPGSAMFKFGCSYGGLRMALTAAQIPFEAVIPRTWQKALGIASKGKQESRTQFKGRLKAKAQQLFPNVKITLATADALLLAEYCRRKRTGTL